MLCLGWVTPPLLFQRRFCPLKDKIFKQGWFVKQCPNLFSLPPPPPLPLLPGGGEKLLRCEVFSCSLPLAPCSLPLAPCSLPLAPCSLPLAPCSCSLLLAPCSLLLAPCSLLLAPCSLLLAPCSLLLTLHPFLLNSPGVMPKCSFTYLPKNEELVNPKRAQTSLMLRSVDLR